MITISLCMIVKNEEEVLGRCLESAAGVADETIVVDTGSSDATAEIARSHGARVYSFPWVDDFSAARNFSFSKATGDYLLWLDADDVLPEQTRRGLILLKEKLDPDVDMVLLPYHIAFDSADRPTFVYYRERLVRRLAGFCWEGEVHEVIPPAGKRLQLPLPVEHRKLRSSAPGRNLRIFEGLLQKGRELTPRQQLYYARELAGAGRDAEAASRFSRFLEEGRGWVEDNIRACLDLAGCRERLGSREAALESVFRSFVYSEPRAEACCAAGDIFLRASQWERAAFWYRLALDCPAPQSRLAFWQPDYASFYPLLQLCVCSDRLGDREAAKAYHLRAKALKPEDKAVQYNERYFASLGETGTQAPCNALEEPV